ncbi:MAG: hypothetical protein CMJ89_17275 [Planctomycetes bacterium]|nr:hypothetical protein [Planctomycetota bacterium]
MKNPQPGKKGASHSPGSLQRHFLLLVGYVTFGCAGDPNPAAETIPFDAARTWRDMETIVGFGERPAGSSNLEKLRNFLEEELRAVELEPRRERFTAQTPRGPVDFCNLVVDLPAGKAAAPNPPICVLCAHIDTKGGMPFRFVGANDGASETAVLLELARQLTARGPTLPIAYRFVFFDGEESVRPEWEGEDNCYGSRHHVRQLEKSGMISRVKACVLIDMVGDADLQLTVEKNSDPALMAIFIGAALKIGLGAHVGGRARALQDDHIPFRAAGIPAVDLIDFEYGPGNSYWHQVSDTLEMCSPDSVHAVGRIVLAGLVDVEKWVQTR